MSPSGIGPAVIAPSGTARPESFVRGRARCSMPAVMRRGRFRLLAVAWVAWAACGDRDEAAPAVPAPIPPSAVEPASVPHSPRTAGDEVPRVLEALGDEGVAVVVLRPHHWAALHGTLAPWLRTLAPEVATVVDGAREPAALPGALLSALGSPSGTVALEGWDLTRPVIASLGEVPYDGPPGAITPQLPTRRGWAPPVRHQAWLPATDPAVLVASIDGLLRRTGEPFPALVEGRAGARGIRIADASVAVLPAGDAVRVVVLHAGVGDEAATLEHLRGRLDASPAAPVATPALGLLVRPDAVLSGLVRPWRMRALATWAGSMEVVRALDVVTPEHRAALVSRGLQIVLDAELLMTDEGAELDDTALSLVVDEGVLRLRTTTSLTPEGEALLTAATRGAGGAIGGPVDDAWIDATVRVDTRAMLDATEPPPSFEGPKHADELARAVQEGGPITMLYMALRHPFGVLRTMEGLAKTGGLPVPIDALPIAARVIWRGARDEVPRVIVALSWPRDLVEHPLAGMVPLVKGEPGFESLRLDTLRHEGRPVTIFGLGGESKSTIAPFEDVGFDGVLQVRVSLSRIGADVATRDPQRGAWLREAGEVLLTVEPRGRALLGELAWAPGGSSVRAVAVPLAESERWASPMGAPVGKGTRCLARAGRRLAQGLGAMATVAGELVDTVEGNTLLDAEPELRCADADPATAKAAASLRALLTEAR